MKSKTLKVNNRNLDPLWKKISCKCDKSDIEKSYPLIECAHCNCKRADDSIPIKPFTIMEAIRDKKGKITGSIPREITEITLLNCDKYGSCIGWNF